MHGHSGTGKTWLLGAFRDVCREAQVPFAQLDAYRLGEDLSPTALLENVAGQLELDVEPGDDGAAFGQLLPCFVAALANAAYPTVALMVDDYDQLFHLVDPWLRNLFRAVQGQDQFVGPPSRRPDVPLDALPCLLAVINLSALSPRVVRVLRLRFGLGGQEPHTLREIGEKMGVTRERIRQIEGKGLRKLRHPRHRRKLEPYL